MYTVLYQWHVHSDKHMDFIAGWKDVSDYYLDNHAALGSRLHTVSNNQFAAYAQRPSKSARDEAFLKSKAPIDAVKKMQQSIINRLEPIEMDVISDKLIHQN